MEYLGWLFAGLLIGVGITFFVMRMRKTGRGGPDSVASLLWSHLHPKLLGASNPRNSAETL